MQKMTHKMQRHDDDEVLTTLRPDQQEVEYNLNRGSIIIADTRCWHKGSLVQNGQRIMMDHVYLAHQLSRNVVYRTYVRHWF